MLNEDLLNALNEQMNHEFYAAHAYMAMAAFCDDNSYEGFANFYIQQAKEERFHGKKYTTTLMIVAAMRSSVLFLHQKQSSQVF